MARKAALPVSRQWQEATGQYRQIMEEDRRYIELEEIWHEDFKA